MLGLSCAECVFIGAYLLLAWSPILWLRCEDPADAWARLHFRRVNDALLNRSKDGLVASLRGIAHAYRDLGLSDPSIEQIVEQIICNPELAVRLHTTRGYSIASHVIGRRHWRGASKSKRRKMRRGCATLGVCLRPGPSSTTSPRPLRRRRSSKKTKSKRLAYRPSAAGASSPSPKATNTAPEVAPSSETTSSVPSKTSPVEETLSVADAPSLLPTLFDELSTLDQLSALDTVLELSRMGFSSQANKCLELLLSKCPYEPSSPSPTPEHAETSPPVDTSSLDECSDEEATPISTEAVSSEALSNETLAPFNTASTLKSSEESSYVEASLSEAFTPEPDAVPFVAEALSVDPSLSEPDAATLPLDPLHVKTPDRVLSIPFQWDVTLGDVKAVVRAEEATACNEFGFLFGQKWCQNDDLALIDYNLHPGATLELVEKAFPLLGGNPDEDVYTICLGTDPQVSKDAARLRAHDSHDAGVKLALEVDDQARAWLEDYVNHDKIPKPEEIKLFWNAFVDKHMDRVGDDHGNCGNQLDEKDHHVFLNFGTNETRERRPGQTRGDRIALDNHTFVFLRHYAVYVALLEGGTPEGELTPAIAAEAFDSRVSYSDYYLVSCDGTPECPRGNNFDKCFEPQLVKDAKARGLSGKTKAEKLCVHNLQARSALAVRALHSIAVGNEKLTVLMASDRSNDKLFNNPNREPIDALLVHIFLTSHPSTFPAQLRHPGNYPREELERMTKHFLGFLQVVFAGAVLSNGTQLSLPSSAEELKLFFKLAGNGDLSPAEMEALLEALHDARVRGGTTTAYSAGLTADGKCAAMVEIGALGGAIGGGKNVLPVTKLMYSTLLSLAEDPDWDMFLPGGDRLSQVSEPDNVKLRLFHLAHAMSAEELVFHQPALLYYRCLTEDERTAARRDAEGDVDEAVEEAALTKVRVFAIRFDSLRQRAERELRNSGQAVPSSRTHCGAHHVTQLIENTIRTLVKNGSYTLPSNHSLPNNRKLSDNEVERQYEIAHALLPKDLIRINPSLGQYLHLTDAEKRSKSEAELRKAEKKKKDKFGSKLITVRRRAAAARKKAAEQAAAEQAALISTGEDESSLVERLEDAVPQCGMRVGVAFDDQFDLGTITGVKKEVSSFCLSVWFDDGSEYDDVMYPAADVRFVVGSDGRPVMDAAHLAFLKNPRYATMMKQRTEKNILLAPSGMAVRPSAITPRCSDDSSGDEGVAAAELASSVRPTVTSGEQKSAKGSKRKSDDPAPPRVRPPKKALLARAREDEAASLLPYEPSFGLITLI